MPGFDRSKLKATSLATVKAQEKDYQSKRPSGGSDRAGYLKIEDGDNLFRIFPFHPDGGGSSFAEAKCVSFLSVKTQKRDADHKPVEGEFEIKRRPIFNSKVHGSLPMDLVEEYLKVAKDVAIPNFVDGDNDMFKKIWGKITGQDGIKPQDTWVVYAAKWEGGKWNLGILELKKTIKNALNDVSAAFSSDIQSPDPFTDPDEGIAVVISKSGKGLDTKYAVSLDSETIREKGKPRTEYKVTPLTDQQLEEWSKLDPLYKTYVNVFKRSDLEAQVDGLKRLDEELAKSGMGITVFAYDEFLDAIDQIDALVPQEGEDKKETKKQQPVAKKSTPKPQPKPTPQPEPEEEEVEEEQVEEEQEEMEVAPPPARPAKIIRKAPAPVEQQEAAAAPVDDVKSRLAGLRARLGKS